MVSDWDVFIDGPWPLIGGNAKQADVDQLMRDNLLPTNKYQPGFTPMVVNTGSELICSTPATAPRVRAATSRRLARGAA